MNHSSDLAKSFDLLINAYASQNLELKLEAFSDFDRNLASHVKCIDDHALVRSIVEFCLRHLPQNNCHDICLINHSILILISFIKREIECQECALKYVEFEVIIMNLVTVLDACMDESVIVNSVRLLELICSVNKEFLSRLFADTAAHEIFLNIICNRLNENMESVDFCFLHQISSASCSSEDDSNICSLCRVVEFLIFQGISDCLRENLFEIFLNMFLGYTYQMVLSECGTSSCTIIRRVLYLQLEEYCNIVLVLSALFSFGSTLDDKWAEFVMELPLFSDESCLINKFTLRSYQLLNQCLYLCVELALRRFDFYEDIRMFITLHKWMVVVLLHISHHEHDISYHRDSSICNVLLTQLTEWITLLQDVNVTQWIDHMSVGNGIWDLIFTFLECISVNVLNKPIPQLIQSIEDNNEKLDKIVFELFETVHGLT